MTRTIDEIREQEGLLISPDIVKSERATVSRSGVLLSVYSFEPNGYQPGPSVSGAILWLWLALVATGVALWWLQQGNEIAVYAVAAMIGVDAYALAHLVRTIYRRHETAEMTYALNLSIGNEYGTNIFESRDKAEVEAVRAEVERVFALEAS